jgi:hypothetical protein
MRKNFLPGDVQEPVLEVSNETIEACKRLHAIGFKIQYRYRPSALWIDRPNPIWTSDGEYRVAPAQFSSW